MDKPESEYGGGDHGKMLKHVYDSITYGYSAKMLRAMEKVYNDHMAEMEEKEALDYE
jgi:hypothetical protein